jgi:hypothetical protein
MGKIATGAARRKFTLRLRPRVRPARDDMGTDSDHDDDTSDSRADANITVGRVRGQHATRCVSVRLSRTDAKRDEISRTDLREPERLSG